MKWCNTKNDVSGKFEIGVSEEKNRKRIKYNKYICRIMRYVLRQSPSYKKQYLRIEFQSALKLQNQMFNFHFITIIMEFPGIVVAVSNLEEKAVTDSRQNISQSYLKVVVRRKRNEWFITRQLAREYRYK